MSETVVMTLADFLLARIAEDERHARKLAETDRRPVLSLAVTVNHPQRLLAECAAKRQVVEGIDGTFRHATEGDRESNSSPWFVLRALASVYADHPEFRDEWRP